MRVRVLVVVAALAAAAPILLLSLAAVTRIGFEVPGDFMTYVGGGRRLVDGLPLYPPDQVNAPFQYGEAAWGMGFVYPPTAAVLFVPLGLVSPASAFVASMTVLAGLLAVLVGLIATRQGLSARWATAFSLAFMILAPTIEAISVGQANTAVAVLLAASWLWPRASGYLAVLGALIKLYPIVGLVWTIRERGPLMRPLVFGTVVVILSLAVLGIDGWLDFIDVMRNARNSAQTLVPSPRALIGPLLGESGSSLVMYLATALVALGALRARSREVAFILVSVAMILPAPDWHYHYLLIPQVGAVPWVASKLVRFGVAWRGAVSSSTADRAA